MVVVTVGSNQPHYEFPNVKKNVFVAFLKIKLLLRRNGHFIYTLLIYTLHSLMQYYGKLIRENLLKLKYRDSQT